MRQRIIRTAGLLTLFMMLSVSSGFAGTVALQLQNTGFGPITITDGGVDDAEATAGVISFSGGVGKWSLNVATGLGAPFLDMGSMDLNSVDSTALGAPGILTIMFSEKDITDSIPFFDMSFGGTAKNISVQYDTYYSNTNTYFATTSHIGTLGPYGATGVVAGFNGDLLGLPAGGISPYSLTQVLTITPTGPLTAGKLHTFSGDATLDPTVPEPSTLLLLGTALVATSLAKRRSRKL